MRATSHEQSEPSRAGRTRPTVVRLRELLSYSPETGVLHWRVSAKGHAAGSIAGSAKARGYREICVDRHRTYVHRVVWALMTGEWPAHPIDHRDRNPSNNAWGNLRAATVRQNQRNRGVARNSKCGLKGVFPQHNGRGITTRFRAQINVGGRRVSLGSFETPELAHAAYARAAELYHGAFAGV